MRFLSQEALLNFNLSYKSGVSTILIRNKLSKTLAFGFLNMPPKKKIFHKTIESVKQFEDLTTNEEPGPLVIIDAYLDWCGPCECMVPNYPSIWFSYDDP